MSEMKEYPDYSLMERRTCQSCGREKLLRFFNGTEVVCQQCDKHSMQAVRRHMRKVTQTVDKELLGHLQNFRDKYKGLPPRQELPNVGTITETLLEGCGGAEGLSLLRWSEFLNSKPGGSVRERHLSSLERMCREADKAGYAKRPLSHYTLDELQEQIKRLAPKVFNLEDHRDHESGEETERSAAV